MDRLEIIAEIRKIVKEELVNENVDSNIEFIGITQHPKRTKFYMVKLIAKHNYEYAFLLDTDTTRHDFSLNQEVNYFMHKFKVELTQIYKKLGVWK